jgi:hypothetical protein
MMGATHIRNYAKDLPLLRGLTHQVSPYFTGSVIENKLGLQVYRAIGKHISWQLRKRSTPKEVRSFVSVLDKDGVLAMHDFLPRDQFLQVRREFEAIEPSLVFNSFRAAENGKIHVATISISQRQKDFPSVRKYLVENPLILTIAETVIRRKISSAPIAAINVYRKFDDRLADNDVENLLHADLHTPTIKVFFYLNDVDEENGAFVYAKGSHRLTFSRLLHEYDISVRTAKLSRGDQNIPRQLLATRGPDKRNVVSDRSLKAMGIRETPVCGKANTLLITNNMGFHRRGEFASSRTRETILLNFRHLEHSF